MVRETGQALFAALLGAGEVAGRYRASAALADERDEDLRIVLRLDAPELAGLPWEAMYDPGTGGTCAVSISWSAMSRSRRSRRRWRSACRCGSWAWSRPRAAWRRWMPAGSVSSWTRALARPWQPRGWPS